MAFLLSKPRRCGRDRGAGGRSPGLDRHGSRSGGLGGGGGGCGGGGGGGGGDTSMAGEHGMAGIVSNILRKLIRVSKCQFCTKPSKCHVQGGSRLNSL